MLGLKLAKLPELHTLLEYKARANLLRRLGVWVDVCAMQKKQHKKVCKLAALEQELVVCTAGACQSEAGNFE